MLRPFTICGSLFVATALLSIGCGESTTYETQKPVIEEPADEQAEETLNDAADDASEAAQEATDAVTPDREKVDVDTPLGDVSVDEDPITGDTKVDVDTGAEE